jgi:adenylate cyclase class 2
MLIEVRRFAERGQLTTQCTPSLANCVRIGHALRSPVSSVGVTVVRLANQGALAHIVASLDPLPLPHPASTSANNPNGMTATASWWQLASATLLFVHPAEARIVHEVEVKYRVEDDAALLAALDRRGVMLSAPSRQDDQAYAPADWRYGTSKVGVPFARLRTQDSRHLFTVKRPVDNELACLEHETVVADRDQMHDALLAMGFVPTVRIVKFRRSARWDEVSLCLDVVDGLGTFVELETLIGAEGSALDAQEALDCKIRALGVPMSRATSTYDSLILAAGGRMGEKE